MSKLRSVKDVLNDYDKRYGDIPLDHDDIMEYLKMKYPRVNMDTVQQMADQIDAIPWETERYIVPIIPKPAARPRYSFETEHFYVPGSSSNKSIMKKILGISESLIATQTKVYVEFYLPTPTYKMNQNEIFLAEMRKIRPVIDPDVDNVLKAYMDAIQGVLITDDNIITSVLSDKFFSVKPRLILELTYQQGFDSAYTEKVLMSRVDKYSA